MCGIIAVVRRPSLRRPPRPDEVFTALDRGRGALGDGDGGLEALATSADAIEEADRMLRGSAGVRALVSDPTLVDELEERVGRVETAILAREEAIDAGRPPVTGAALEELNATLVRLKDASWALGHDRLSNARAVADLAGPVATPEAIDAYASVQVALSGLDRLEVRGRDSAGLQIVVDGHGLDVDAPDLEALLDPRADDDLFTSQAVRVADGSLSFVYKAAAEIGELGDNTRALRKAVRSDELLRRALTSGPAQATVLAHTRWASVGVISEANAHPLDSREEGRLDGGLVTAALNGDVDNHNELRQAAGLVIPIEVTTDAKVIPLLVARAMEAGASVEDAFRSTVATFEGSVAIAGLAADAPGRLLLALRGSGQSLNIGLAEDTFVVASEPYGLVEETGVYLRMDGEATTGGNGEPGQVVVLDRSEAGTLEGLERLGYDGTPVPVADDEVHVAEITTRDIDRGEFPHFLLKEVSEAPQSMRKTLRGKLVPGAEGTTVRLGDETLPPAVVERFGAGSVRQVTVTGMGTAAVAGQSLAALLAEQLVGTGVEVRAEPATELSGFGLRDDMSDTVVVAISQSGTTTDVNRTVDLVRARGAAVLAIVNRRNSDLVEKADGVLYTSDGRDVEMSVASTKAFYGQIAAGALLVAAIARAAGRPEREMAPVLDGLRDLPAAMETVLARRHVVAEAALLAPPRRSWAVVGNGRNRVAAEEVRIKLSELCYKSIACDVTEDKKHIDLSSEPLIFVCAPGLDVATADDVAKEVAIYGAHKAASIVVATEGDERYSAALAVIEVPAVHPSLAFVLAAMAGHLFGYEAALAVDASARPLREARAAVEVALSTGDDGDLVERLANELAPAAARFGDALRAGTYDGSMEASTAVRLSTLLRFASGRLPLDLYSIEYGKVGTPVVVVEDLTNALTAGIEELTRPIDAIKHQAKTVTVGISRSEEALLDNLLAEAVLAAGAGRDRLGYRTQRTLAALAPAVVEVTGWTHYRVEGVPERSATIHVLDRAGVAATIESRTERAPALRGMKRRAATTKEVWAAVGRKDGRELVVVPETKDGVTVGMVLLHVRYADRLEAEAARAVLEGYQGRFAALVDAVTETEAWRDEVLAEVPMVELLTRPVHVLADHWRS